MPTTFVNQMLQLFKRERSGSIRKVNNSQSAAKLKRRFKSNMKDGLTMSLGVLSAGFGLKGFLIPIHLIDGGVTGISLLTNAKTGISFSLLIVLLNLPFLFLGYKQIGKAFMLKSICTITALAIVVAVVPFPIVTSDKLLVAVFGGFFLGGGVGLAIRGGAVIDGTEVLAIWLSRKSSFTVGDLILLFNVAIFTVAAYLLSPEIALYSILTYLSASKTVDFILEGIEEFTGVTIISDHSRQISAMIKNKLGRGMTIYTGRKGFGKTGESDQEVDIIFTVITRLEINRLTTEVENIDHSAFIVMQSIRDTRGGMVKKLPLKEH